MELGDDSQDSAATYVGDASGRAIFNPGYITCINHSAFVILSHHISQGARVNTHDTTSVCLLLQQNQHSAHRFANTVRFVRASLRNSLGDGAHVNKHLLMYRALLISCTEICQGHILLYYSSVGLGGLKKLETQQHAP